jgi:non-specific serine/threonine protein kinase
MSRAPSLAAHGGEATAVVNGQLYIAAGFGSLMTEVYDPGSNSWSAKASFPDERCYPAGGAIGTKIYIAGGCDGCDCRVGTTNALAVYDPKSDAWTSGATMPTPRSSAAVGVISGKLYVAGGSGPCPPCTPLSTLEAYDPTSDSWQSLKSMPTARRGLANAAVVGGNLYVIGGVIVGAGGDTGTAAVEAYDPVADSWTTLPSLPRPLYEVGAVSFGGGVLAVGGDDPALAALTTDVDLLNPAGGAWTPTAPIPQVLYGATCGEIGGVAYCVGAGSGNTASSALQEFTCP